MFKDIYDKVKNEFPQIESVAADAGYKVPYICKQILEDARIPVMPYKRYHGKKELFRPYEFEYDRENDCVICPYHQKLRYSTTNRDGYREYKSDRKVCANCPMRLKCTQSKNCQKTFTRHIWADYMETAEAIRHTQWGKETYKKRAETIERVFADAKEKHGMRYTTLRGKAKVTMQVLLTFACMNLKKLAIRKSRDPRFRIKNSFSLIFFPHIFLSLKTTAKSTVWA